MVLLKVQKPGFQSKLEFFQVAVILAIIFLSYTYNTIMPRVSYVKVRTFYDFRDLLVLLFLLQLPATLPVPLQSSSIYALREILLE